MRSSYPFVVYSHFYGIFQVQDANQSQSGIQAVMQGGQVLSLPPSILQTILTQLQSGGIVLEEFIILPRS